jgi:S-adenosylmethionine:tRNA ribosyltransferase-isomerase
MPRILPPDPAQYDYTYPASLIAQTPSQPRDSARLLIYDRATGSTVADSFTHIANYLPPRAVLVFNQTQVVPARLYARKATGGTVELLYIGKNVRTFDALANRSLKIGEVLTLDGSGVGAAFRRPRSKFGRLKLAPTVTVVEMLSKGFRFSANFPIHNLFKILAVYGNTPIPPYIKHTNLSEQKLRREYQTVFARAQGSSAAPTASLHFTKKLLSALQKQGIATEYITLHVGLGTFAPLTEKHLASGTLHKEWYEISPVVWKRLQQYKKQGRPIIAVGTTVVRTLESVARRKVSPTLTGETDLFIYPPYKHKMVDGLITNFHVPKSSLLMLVASFIGREKLLQLYKHAITKRFRLFSFGDGMLIK